MDVIFVKLPKYLDPVSILIRKLGHRVYYLELSQGLEDTNKTKNIRIEKLKKSDIVPLPIESLDYINLKVFFDANRISFQRAQQIAPTKMLKSFGQLFPNTHNIVEKLQFTVHLAVLLQIMDISGKINVWACENQDKKCLLIDVSPNWLRPKLAPNVRTLVIPLDIFAKGLDKIIHTFLQLLPKKGTFGGKSECLTDTHKLDTINHSRVAFVTHKGLNFGNLYQQDLFYSTRMNSELHPEKLLHLDYSGVPSPSKKIKWVCVCNLRKSWISNITFAFVAMSKGILHIRHIRDILGLLIVARSYVIFKSYSRELEAFPDLKMALIDYEILCPKELLLAFESKDIQTIATQERFIFAFYRMSVSIFLNHYLCASQFAADVMKGNPLNCIDHYIPVGQYRSDNLLEAKKSPPPQILKAPLAKGLRIITALGFHTQMEWQNSQGDLYLSWKAHLHFLEDMIRLSEEIPDVFIILRYKDVDWMPLPIFAETIQKIKSSDNMTISIDYEKVFFSYDLCAHSDLVIAKHTSLGDECISVGIPVLFHEYTHNTERLLAEEFDYSPTRIMCFNYQELKERAQIILSGTPNAMTEDYEYLKNVVYGGLGDGKVRERIHAYIERMLTEM